MLFGIAGGILLLAAIIGYVLAAKSDNANTSRLKKDQKAALKKKSRTLRVTAHSLFGVAVLALLVAVVQATTSNDALEKLNYQAQIEVTTDRDYGREHSDMPVKYEMKFPTSGTHSPHDLKFGYYDKKPQTELLVHNLEHGDILIYYRPNADASIKEAVKELARVTKAGAGVLAVPSDEIPEGQEVILNAWTKTLELPKYDEQKAGTFIYRFINEGPEQIPASIRRGGGTM
jgi:hypothetical protein